MLTIRQTIAIVLLCGFTIASPQHYAMTGGDCCDEYCYSTDDDRVEVRQYSTKTAYIAVKGPSTNAAYYEPNCSPVKFWLLSRHGTRLPDIKDMEKMRELEHLREQIIDNYDVHRSKPPRGAFCESDLNLLRNWRYNSNISEIYDQFLTVQGWNEIKFLARHFSKVYTNIFPVDYHDRSRMQFRHTDTQRTEASFKAFVEGLFGQYAWENVRIPRPPKNDTLLKAYDNCPAWKEKGDMAKAEGSEFKKFVASRRFQDTLSQVSQRLGFKFSISEKQLDTIWDTCRFEQAWNQDRPSPWCVAFTEKHIDVLEYLEDLKYYYKSGYGNPLSPQVPCELVKNMLGHLSNDSDPRVIAYFTHSAAIQTFLTALGIARDKEPLRADNFDQQSNRVWRTSKIGPFGANLAVIKYDCPNEAEREKVKFILNERSVDFDFCRVGLCDLSKLQDRYKRYLSADCKSFFCDPNGVKPVHASIFTVVVSLMIAYLGVKL